MLKINQLRRALHDGGVPEVIRRTRLWSARRLHPKPTPAPPPEGHPALVTAHDVDHAAAFAWFESRKATYERLASVVAPYVEPNGTIFDVGANIGYFTLVLAQRTAFRGTAHLFEPVPNLAALCAATLADVPFTARIHAYGLSESDSTLDLYLGADGNLGWNTLVAGKASASMPTVQIQVRNFSATGIVDVPDFIKIDVEGAEHRVLGGMVEALATWPKKPVILCEIGWGSSHPDWDAELAAFGDLAALGYRVTDLEGEPLEIADLTRTTDVLFLPA